jgi:hypothetical protein
MSFMRLASFAFFKVVVYFFITCLFSDPFFAVTSTGQKKVVFSKKFSSIKGKQFEFFSKDITVFQDLLIEFYHKVGYSLKSLIFLFILVLFNFNCSDFI